MFFIHLYIAFLFVWRLHDESEGKQLDEKMHEIYEMSDLRYKSTYLALNSLIVKILNLKKNASDMNLRIRMNKIFKTSNIMLLAITAFVISLLPACGSSNDNSRRTLLNPTLSSLDGQTLAEKRQEIKGMKSQLCPYNSRLKIDCERDLQKDFHNCHSGMSDERKTKCIHNFLICQTRGGRTCP